MKRAMLAVSLGIITLVGVTSEASAWTKFRNRSSFTIWTAHAHASMSGFLCGYNDTCDVFGDWRVIGWWQLAPGQVKTVNGMGYGNAYHDAYGEDGTGRVWGGGAPNTPGGHYCMPQTASDHCSGACPSNMRSLHFFRARGTRCCGGSCPADGYVNFNN
jgi:hypothetical protein